MPPAQVDINRDAETLYSGANPVLWKGGDSELKIGGWHAYKIDDNEADDWVADLELEGALAFDPPMPDELRLSHKPRVLVLYGSLRPESYSRKLAFECARILERLGCDVRVFHAQGLPLRDPEIDDHPKVQELRQLSEWSEGHVWVSPEMHGEVTGAFKTQIDWLPLNTGSVRPTQGRTVMIAQVMARRNSQARIAHIAHIGSSTRADAFARAWLRCALVQVCGGSQSFNVVNTLRKLARWMRMPCVTNQSSVPKAWQEFDDKGRMKPSPLRDRVVDVCEEFYKFTLVRYSGTRKDMLLACLLHGLNNFALATCVRLRTLVVGLGDPWAC